MRFRLVFIYFIYLFILKSLISSSHVLCVFFFLTGWQAKRQSRTDDSLSADKCHSLSQIKDAHHHHCNPCNAAKLVFPSLPFAELSRDQDRKKTTPRSQMYVLTLLDSMGLCGDEQEWSSILICWWQLWWLPSSFLENKWRKALTWCSQNKKPTMFKTTAPEQRCVYGGGK